jgi:hypothetical protein
MSEQESQSALTPTQNVQSQPAQVQTQEVSSPLPAKNMAIPDKTVSVPKFAVCMAGDATPIEAVVRAVMPAKADE